MVSQPGGPTWFRSLFEAGLDQTFKDVVRTSCQVTTWPGLLAVVALRDSFQGPVMDGVGPKLDV